MSWPFYGSFSEGCAVSGSAGWPHSAGPHQGDAVPGCLVDGLHSGAVRERLEQHAFFLGRVARHARMGSRSVGRLAPVLTNEGHADERGSAHATIMARASPYSQAGRWRGAGRHATAVG